MTEPTKSNNQTTNLNENIEGLPQSNHTQAYDAIRENSEIVAKIMSGNFANFVEKEEKINESVKLFEEIDNYEIKRKDFLKKLQAEGIILSIDSSKNNWYIFSFKSWTDIERIPDIVLQEQYSHFVKELKNINEVYEKISVKLNLKWYGNWWEVLPTFHHSGTTQDAIQGKNLNFLKYIKFDKEQFLQAYRKWSVLEQDPFSQQDIDFIKENFDISLGKEDFENIKKSDSLEILLSDNQIFDVEFSRIEIAEEWYEKIGAFSLIKYLIKKTNTIPEKFRKSVIENAPIFELEELYEYIWKLNDEEKQILWSKISKYSWWKFLDVLEVEDIIELHKNASYYDFRRIFENISEEKRQPIFDYFIRRKDNDENDTDNPDWLETSIGNEFSRSLSQYMNIAKDFWLKIDFTFFQKSIHTDIENIFANQDVFMNFDSRKLFEIEYSHIFESFPEIVNSIFEKSQNNTYIIKKLLEWLDSDQMFLNDEDFQEMYKNIHWEDDLEKRLEEAKNHTKTLTILKNPEIISKNIEFLEVIKEMTQLWFSPEIFQYHSLLSPEEIQQQLEWFKFLKKHYEKMDFLEHWQIQDVILSSWDQEIFFTFLKNSDFSNLSIENKKFIFRHFLKFIKTDSDISAIIKAVDENNFWGLHMGYWTFENINEIFLHLESEKMKDEQLAKIREGNDFLIEKIFKYSLEDQIESGNSNFEHSLKAIQNLYKNHHRDSLISAANHHFIDYEFKSREFSEILADFMETIKLFERLLDSPSTEVKKLARHIFAEIIKLENPVEFIEKIEKIFLDNRLPKAGYLFRIFHELYDDDKIAYQINKSTSPYLQRLYKEENTDFLHATFFKDLLKTHIYSGERSIKNFLTEMSESKKILKKYENEENLSEEEIQKLHDISLTLASLYQNKWVNIADAIEDSGNFEENFKKIQQSLGVNNFREIFEYFEKIFLSKIGFENSESALNFMNNHQNEINARNEKFAKNHNFSLQQGDMIKWFESNIYNFIANEGFVARDFLGTEGQSDATPFDIDLIRLAEDTDFADAINHHIAKDYGDAMAVFKKSKNLVETNTENPIPTYKSHAFELFKTEVLSEDHFGIRTAVPTSEVSFYVLKNPHPLAREEFFFHIAKSGRYIPVVDTDQNLIFSYEDFEKFQEKIFSGISEWSEKNYKISEHKTTNPNILSKIIQEIPNDNEIANVKSSLEKIFTDIDEILAHYGINKRKNGDKTKIGYEIQSMGSTSRNTFLGGKNVNLDFDINIKLDEEWFQKLEQILTDCQTKFPSKNIEIFHNSNGSVQLLHGEKDENGTKLEIDLLFSKFSENTTIDANKAIEQRLQNILKTHGKEKYYEILANIRAAKRWAKEIEVYKKWSYGQGGLGGIGIEVWILSHGGSFEVAKNSFLEAAFDQDGNLKSFEDFRKNYPIFGAGENIKSPGKVENFVNNMEPSGYEKFATELKKL